MVNDVITDTDSLDELEKKNTATELLNLIRAAARDVTEEYIGGGGYEKYYNMTVTNKTAASSETVTVGTVTIDEIEYDVTATNTTYTYDVYDEITQTRFEGLDAKCSDDISVGDLVRVYVGNDYKYIGFKF